MAVASAAAFFCNGSGVNGQKFVDFYQPTCKTGPAECLDGTKELYIMRKIVIAALALILAMGLVMSCKQEPAFYTVRFEKNDDRVMGEMDPQLMKPDTETALYPNQYSPRESWEFAEWNTEPDGSGTSYGDEAKIKLTGDLTLYAQWQKEKVTIKFVENGGIGEMADQVVERRSLVALSKNEFKRSGYKFLGWAEKPDALFAQYPDEYQDEFDADLVLYAVWEAQIDNTKWEYKVGDDVFATIELKAEATEEKTTRTMTIDIPEVLANPLVGSYYVYGGDELEMIIEREDGFGKVRYAFIGKTSSTAYEVAIIKDTETKPETKDFVRDFGEARYYYPSDYLEITDPKNVTEKYSVLFIDMGDETTYMESSYRNHEMPLLGDVFYYGTVHSYDCVKEEGKDWDYKIPAEYEELTVLTSMFDYNPGESLYLFLEIPGSVEFNLYKFTPVSDKD